MKLLIGLFGSKKGLSGELLMDTPSAFNRKPPPSKVKKLFGGIKFSVDTDISFELKLRQFSLAFKIRKWFIIFFSDIPLAKATAKTFFASNP